MNIYDNVRFQTEIEASSDSDRMIYIERNDSDQTVRVKRSDGYTMLANAKRLEIMK